MTAATPDKHRPSLWQRAAQVLGHLPSQCLVCRSWPSDWICASCAQVCWQPGLRRCSRCALPLPASTDVCAGCLRDTPLLQYCHAAVDYSPPWDGMVLRLKFHQQLAWANRMAQLLLRTPGVLASLQQASVILPVPLSAGRMRERGYNQALLLAKALCRQAPTGLVRAQVQPRYLQRLLDTPAQAGLDRAARLRNLRHAFALRPGLQAQDLGACPLLVDDVMTTGATLGAVAQLLQTRGAPAVQALVFARTPAPGQ